MRFRQVVFKWSAVPGRASLRKLINTKVCMTASSSPQPAFASIMAYNLPSFQDV